MSAVLLAVGVAVESGLVAVRNLVPHFLFVFLSDLRLDGRPRVHISEGSVAARSTVDWLVVVGCGHERVLAAGLTGPLNWSLWLHEILLLRLLKLLLRLKLLLLLTVGVLTTVDIPNVVDDQSEDLVILNHK